MRHLILSSICLTWVVFGPFLERHWLLGFGRVGAWLILAIAFLGAIASVIALIGSLLIAVSYTQVGHVLGDPRWVLTCPITVHLLAVGFWVAALAPLHKFALQDSDYAILRRFGEIAGVTVPVLVLVGLAFAWFMSGSLTVVLSTSYGQALLITVIFFSGLLSLAALNKLRLVPALEQGGADTAPKPCRSIKIEGFVVLLILITTATFTSVTTPPVNL